MARALGLPRLAAGRYSGNAPSGPVEVFTIGLGAANVPVQQVNDRDVVILGGVAGALDPQLKSGDVVVEAEAGKELGTIVFHGKIETVDRVLGGLEEKAQLFRKTAALAVDMEGAVVRRLFPHFVHVRGIVDTAADVLPVVFRSMVDEAGKVRPVRLLRLLLTQPWLIKDLLRIGRQNAQAESAMAQTVMRMVIGWKGQ